MHILKIVTGFRGMTKNTFFSWMLLAAGCLAGPAGAADPAAALPPAASTTTPASLASGTEHTPRLVQLVGSVVRLREGSQRAAVAGMALRSGDILELAPDAKAALELGAQGSLQIGGAGRLVVENRATRHDPDAPTILNLQRGEVHATWQSASAPLYIYARNWRVTLEAGEYFIHNPADPADTASHLCVAAGYALFHAIDSSRNGALKPGLCEDLGDVAASQAPFAASRQLALRNALALPAVTLVASAADADTPGPTIARGTAPARAATAGVETATIQARPVAPSVPGPLMARPPTAAAGATAVRPSASPAPDDAAAPMQGEEGRWAINVASYDEQATAEKQRAQLAGAGYAAIVVPARINGRTWYRVQLPGFVSREDARARIASLDAALTNGGTLWVTRQH